MPIDHIPSEGKRGFVFRGIRAQTQDDTAVLAVYYWERSWRAKATGAVGFTWLCCTAKPWATSCGPKQKGIFAQCYHCSKTSKTCGPFFPLPFTESANNNCIKLDHMLLPHIPVSKQLCESWIWLCNTFLLDQNQKLQASQMKTGKPSAFD